MQSRPKTIFAAGIMKKVRVQMFVLMNNRRGLTTRKRGIVAGKRRGYTESAGLTVVVGGDFNRGLSSSNAGSLGKVGKQKRPATVEFEPGASGYWNIAGCRAGGRVSNSLSLKTFAAKFLKWRCSGLQSKVSLPEVRIVIGGGRSKK